MAGKGHLIGSEKRTAVACPAGAYASLQTGHPPLPLRKPRATEIAPSLAQLRFAMSESVPTGRLTNPPHHGGAFVIRDDMQDWLLATDAM
jgi:hypothetical protein